MVVDGLTRSGINKRVRRIRRVFEWAVANEVIPNGVNESLRTVDGLKRGRTDAPESKRVACVPGSHIDAIKRFVLPPVWAMIQLQRYAGMRPGEVVTMRGNEIESTGEICLYQPRKHKNAHRGQSRVVSLGPKAQRVLRPWMSTTGDLFSPAKAMEALRERRAQLCGLPAMQSSA